MSLPRRQYDARKLAEIHAEPAEVALAWDEEASYRALEQTRSVASRDPEASQYLASQLMAQPHQPSGATYNPSELYAQMLVATGLKAWEIDRMHFVHFFAQVREVVLLKERERAAYQDQQPVTYESTFE